MIYPGVGDLVGERESASHHASLFSGRDPLQSAYVGRISPGETALVVEAAKDIVRVVTSAGQTGWVYTWNLKHIARRRAT